MMTGTVKQPQTAPPGPAWPTGTRPRGAAAKAQLLLSPAGCLAPHTCHHELPKCPEMEDFWPPPAGPSQRIPSLLEGGVSATNSSEIPSCAPRPPGICSQDPFSRILAGTPHSPRLPRPCSISRATRSSSSTWEVEEETSVPTSVTAVPTASPCCCCCCQPSTGEGGRGADGQSQPQHFQPGKPHGSQSRFLNGGSSQPTIIQQLICAHGWQREQ